MKIIKINLPEGYEIDLLNSTPTEIKLKPLLDRELTYEDFGPIGNCYYINKNSKIEEISSYTLSNYTEGDINTLDTRGECEEILALCQLIRWRNKVVDKSKSLIYYITTDLDRYRLIICKTNYGRVIPFSFNDREQAELFLKQHKTLLTKAIKWLG